MHVQGGSIRRRRGKEQGPRGLAIAAGSSDMDDDDNIVPKKGHSSDDTKYVKISKTTIVLWLAVMVAFVGYIVVELVYIILRSHPADKGPFTEKKNLHLLLTDPINLPHDLPPIYWINLDTSADRREAMMDMFSSQGIANAHRVSGVTADEARHLLQTGHLVIHPDLYSWRERIEQLFREAAATLSHLRAIKQAYDAQHEFAFIFEDDAILSRLFQDEWRGYADLAPSGWKILQFATNNLPVAKQGALALTDPFTTWYGYHWSARAYLINRAGMKTLMEKVHSSVAGQDFWHIDDEMIVPDEVVYAVTGDTYTSTGLWIDDFNMKTTIQVDDQEPGSDIMNSYLPSIVGDPESQIAMKTTGNVFEESLLVLTSVTVGDEEDIAKSIRWIIQDSTVCKFHHKCEWHIGFVASNSELMKMIREVYVSLPLPSNIHFHESINPRPSNKFIFIQNFTEQMMDFDLVLLKDVDMRIIGFPWRTFVERKKDTNAAIVGPLRQISLTRQRSGEFEPHWFGLHEALRWPDWGWSSTLFDKVMPIEVPYLEQYFVLMDAKFANFFFNLALRPELVHHSSDWGIDLAWCAAAEDWDGSRPGCHLIPVVAFQDDYKHTMQRSVELEDEGFEAIKTYSGDSILGRWIKTSSHWRDIIGGKDLDEIQHECRGLFSLDAADSFDLQACATRASGEGMLQP